MKKENPFEKVFSKTYLIDTLIVSVVSTAIQKE